MNWPTLIAHRGASAIAPENTFAAFELVNKACTTWIECDVTLSKDNKAIIFHDKTLKRQFGINKKINQLTIAEISSLDAGLWFDKKFQDEPIPTLEKLLVWAKKNKISLNLEIKANGYRLKKLIEVLKELIIKIKFPLNQLLLSSFEIKALKYAKILLQAIKRGLLMHRWRRRWKFVCKNLEVSSVHCHYKLLNLERVKKIKHQGYQLYAYTINHEQLAEQLFTKGVDGVFSDRIDLFKASK